MNCEHIRELLSDYLDDKLAPIERQNVLQHLSTCDECRAILNDYRRLDTLLANLPRVGPDPALRDRIFSSPAYQELATHSPTTPSPALNQENAQTVPHPRLRNEQQNHRPHLVALPGGRASSSERRQSHAMSSRPTRRNSHWVQRTMQIMIAATLLLTVGVAGLIGWNMWQRHPQTAILPGAITPPAGLQQNGGPLPAGTRFTFLRDGALWSAPSDGSTSIVRLTPPGVNVAPDWTVRAALPGHSAGNMLAYIDLQRAYIHTIRSDSQNDSVIRQPLLRPGATPAIWNTATGTAILNSMSWSKNGNQLAFVADPTGSGQPELYLYSVDTNQVHAIPLPQKGGVSHPTWSPDGKRIAFVQTQNGQVSLLDYNIQTNDVLTIASSSATGVGTNDTVLQLAWANTATIPTITWSVGITDHIHTIWSQQVGVGNIPQPHLLAKGDFTEATLNATQSNAPSAWLLITSQAGISGDALRLDLQGNLLRLTSGKQVYMAQWSPDSAYISYFSSLSSGAGALHMLNITTGSDIQIASNALTNPSPVWSQNAQHLAYRAGSRLFVVDTQNAGVSQPLKLQGTASMLTWSPATSSQMVVALSTGLYLVDTQHDTSLQLDTKATTGSILWTQIP